jgi:hypothetical protein
MRVLRSWLVATLAACLFASQALAQTAPAVAGLDAATLQAIENQVSQIRGLKPTVDPDLQLLDHTSLRSYLVDEFERNYLPNERESDQKQLVALGLLQPTDDLVQIQLNLLNEQVIGVYDTDTRSLFVVSDQGSFGPAARITYAHEFDHALQDQHYGLNKIAPKHNNANDRSLAVRGLIEGDALMLQTLWAQQNLTPDDLVQLSRESAAGVNAGLAEAPLIIRSELLFPYTAGFNFVRTLYRQANNSYATIDDAFMNPPESTAQVLHPDKFLNQVHPVDVQLPDIATALGPAWRQVGTGVLGELDTRVLLEQYGLTLTEASRVAAGWSGDRWQVVDRDGQTAITLESTWNSEGSATQFFSAYTRTLLVRLDVANIEESSRTRQALTTPTTATDVRVQGSTVLAVIAFDRDSANAIVDAVTSYAP